MKLSHFNYRIVLRSLFVCLFTMATSINVFADNSSDDEITLLGHSLVLQATSVDNKMLAKISGLGLESQKLTLNSQLSVILWDEINKGKHQQSLTSREDNTNTQSVSLSISNR